MDRSSSDGRRPVVRMGWLVVLLLYGVGLSGAWAERISDIRRTKHNLSAIDYAGGPTRTVKAVSENELCVFCHTPHGATSDTTLKAPLWNRQLSTATYTGTYESTSLQADVNELRAGPGGSSKLCLSCHDGTVAVGSVGVLAGKMGGNTIAMSGTGTGGVMPSGAGNSTGFTRNLGTDLSNDHPISFTYNAAVATADGELRTPPYSSGAALVVGNRSAGAAKPVLPLDDSKVQCASCHDPHIRDNTEVDPIKFLRLNRFQKTPPSGSSFGAGNDIVCLACHDKGKMGWAESVHANSSSGNVAYTSAATTLREFPSGIKVWEAACLNCHDTHTVPGARRLLREGTDSTLSPKQGGRAAVEETCYQCHTTSAQSILTTPNTVPDIKSEFASVVRMPIATADQANGTTEVHSIIDHDFQENPATLGKGNLSNRHAECTDCHNPHRAMKNRLFDGAGASTAATHLHDTTARHSNLASGALRGSWGVEPDYSGVATWGDLPSYTVKKGDGGVGASTLRTAAHVTREYQICLKCHSDYGYNDDKVYPAGATRPQLGSFIGGTLTGTNGLSRYTNQGMEFAVFANDAGSGADQGEPGGNHRSWHPVLFPTGRTLAVRGGLGNSMWLSPWNRSSTDVGNLTMYCSDCHGSATAAGVSAPNAGKPWGPHGSSNNFILKGAWDQNTGAGRSNDLCFKCHDYNMYATENATKSGFCCDKSNNLHGVHAKRITSGIKCSRCHAAVPHGWKNKAFLVNLNSVGGEAGLGSGTKVGTANSKYTQAPYYMDAALRVLNWRASGGWLVDDCGWSSTNKGIDWMKSTCK
ncbi:MAG: hypothetical protein HQL88_01710 [Magnetococcales bacterium]|nr:hypothetical protein [Magnetococcales bacterium]